MEINKPTGGINVRVESWDDEMEERKQCVSLENLRYRDGCSSPVPGSMRYHGITLHAGKPVTAILPYYNDQTGDFKLLAACGSRIFKRNPVANEFEEIMGGLTDSSIFSGTIRHGVLYIASVSDGLKKYLGGLTVETVGGGITVPGSFRQILYMKEVDRLFGISHDVVYGQISWCDFGEPEVWDGANTERIKLQDGERVEGGEILFGKLVVLCTYGIWIYYVAGNEENWKLEQAPSAVGCVAPATIKKVGTKILYLGESPKFPLGIYEFDGSTSKLISDDISPIFKNVNRNKIRNACAEVHDGLYTISFAYEGSEKNDKSVDFDIMNLKADGTPVIFGIHDFGFYSSCVLDGVHNGKEFLMGGEDDGFVYREHGTTFKSTNGVDGSLIRQRFLSRTHIDEERLMKQYQKIGIYFRPRAYFNTKLKYYLSTGSFGTTENFSPSVQVGSVYGDFNVFESRIFGTPGHYMHDKKLGLNSRGTSIQIELINDTLNQNLCFEGYDYKKQDLYEVKEAVSYAI